jgi:hypothetical protein
VNERIRELAEQADWWIPLGLPSDWNEGDYVVSPTQLKKFAQSIVQECAELLPPEMTHGPDGRPLEQVFKQHFGVEL